MNSRQMLEKLLSAESEEEVNSLVENTPEFKDESNWYPYGGVENNFGVIANQQRDSLSALVEKIVNSTDALMVRKCLEHRIDPTSVEAPESLSDAAEKFFGVPNGSLCNLESQDRKRELAENVFVVATGSRSQPTLSIVDRGEGQHPEDFESTFLSLQASNKLKIPFVQGRFNMGGTGALPFAGRKGFQLILSKKHPDTASEVPDSRWGWTLVRKRPPKDQERSPSYVYFKIDGQIPSFSADSLPLLPKGENPRKRDLEGGSYIKLYDYKLSPATILTTSLYRRLNLKLFYVPVPITLHECRDYQAKTRFALLEGQRNRLEDVRYRDNVVVRPDFPIESRVQISRGEYIKVKTWLLKDEVDTSRWTRPSEAICLTVNGQTHANFDRRFFARESVKKDYIKNNLLVEVDCSDLSAEFVNDVFMASRDRLRDLEETQKMEKTLEKLFREDDLLKDYDKIWREKKIQETVDETKSATEILKGFMKVSPEIASLLKGGDEIPLPPDMDFDQDPIIKPFLGEKFPSHLTLKKPKDGVLCVPKSTWRKVVFETDVENSYLSRPVNPGSLEISKGQDWVRTSSLRNGELIFNISPPDGMEVGDETELVFSLSGSPVDDQEFERSLKIEVVSDEEKEEKKKEEDKDKQKNKDRLQLPLITAIRKEDWDMFGWDEYSVASVHTHEMGTDVFVNLDNHHLQSTLRNRDFAGKESQIENLFKIGIGLISFSLKSQVGEDLLEETEQKVLNTLAAVWLPTILRLKDLV